MRDRFVLIYSGGLDSTTLLYHLRDKGHTVKCLSVFYGQRHDRELASAQMICERLGVEFMVAELGGIRPLLAGSSLTDPAVDVPEGHYAEESMKQTVVPNRNMIMLAVAVAWAISLKFEAVAYAAHSGDHAIYPDCRTEFIKAMQQAIPLCDWHKVKLLAPFARMDKIEIVKRGLELGVPYGMTWTCYMGGAKACGRCGSCVERLEAFEKNGAVDPIAYE